MDEGWPLGAGITVRLARREDMSAVRALSAMAGRQLDEQVTAAVDAGVVAAALREGVSRGEQAAGRHMAEQFFLHQRGDRSVPLQHMTLVLVAEHDQQGIMGALAACPPVAVIQQLLDHLKRTGASGYKMAEGRYAVAQWIARVVAIAVTEPMRGRGIGGALLDCCLRIYDRSGCMIMFGQVGDTPASDHFFARHGFDVLPPGAGFDPWIVLGIHAEVRPGPGERTFVWNRPDRSQRRRSQPERAWRSTASPELNSNEQTGQSGRATSTRPAGRLPLLSAGAVSLLIDAGRDMCKAPLTLMAAAACQAARGSADGLRLHHQFVAGLRHLGFTAQLIPARVAVRPEQARGRPQFVGVDLTSAGRAFPLADLHTAVWVVPFRTLVDITVFYDDVVQRLASELLTPDFSALLAAPAMLKVSTFDTLTAPGVLPAVERGPVTLGWQLFPDRADVLDLRAWDRERVEEGGRALAEATTDLLLAAASHTDPEPMFTEFPHLRAILASRSESLWSGKCVR